MIKPIETISKKMNISKKSAIVLIIGVVAVIMLVITELMPDGEISKNSDKSLNIEENNCERYEQDVENRLCTLISQIDGAGSVKVMVTLESTNESVYAKKEKGTANEGGTTYDNDYIIVKSDNGEDGILIKVTRPEIRGVAVVCTGGNSAVVRQNITDTVSAVLGISSARVNVTAMKKSNGG